MFPLSYEHSKRPVYFKTFPPNIMVMLLLTEHSKTRRAFKKKKNQRADGIIWEVRCKLIIYLCVPISVIKSTYACHPSFRSSYRLKKPFLDNSNWLTDQQP